MNYASLKEHYTTLLDNVIISPHWEQTAKEEAEKINLNKARYQSVAGNIPWYVIGIIHCMEAGLAFNCYLGNGELLSRRTTLTPRGRGPFKSWEEGARDALVIQGLYHITDWCDEEILYQLEAYNGFGYWMHGINSPYLWSGTNHYTKGKFVETIRGSYFNHNLVSEQIGAVPILIKLKDIILNG